ncbi:hypothetical protein BGX20_000230 [Mortierella sp. AD010]|nr:hypothetical protein BGX20_000230 [Mortierella sp. AD010]
MNPSAGLGALTAMGDAVVLANYINTLTTVGSEDVEKVLKAYTAERYPVGKASVEISADRSKTIKQDFTARLMRAIIKHIPKWLWIAINAKSIRSRPQISFLPLVEDKCKVKVFHQPSLKDTRPKDMAVDV